MLASASALALYVSVSLLAWACFVSASAGTPVCVSVERALAAALVLCLFSVPARAYRFGQCLDGVYVRPTCTVMQCHAVRHVGMGYDVGGCGSVCESVCNTGRIQDKNTS